MPIDFYYAYGSCLCRSVQLTAAVIGLELEMKEVRLDKREQLKPEFLKINPNHCVPTIVDNGFSLWERHAVVLYLVEKYGKDETFYPKDLQKRAIIHQRLCYDCSTLFPNIIRYYFMKSSEQGLYDAIVESMRYVDGYIGKGQYVAGDNLTVADIVLYATISTYEVMGFDFTDYPNIRRWLDVVKTAIPNYEEIDKQRFHAKVTAERKRLNR